MQPPIIPAYEVRYVWLEDAEYWGPRREKRPFKTFAEAQAFASRVNANKREFLTTLHGEGFSYIQEHPTIWCVYHHEERVS